MFYMVLVRQAHSLSFVLMLMLVVPFAWSTEPSAQPDQAPTANRSPETTTSPPLEPEIHAQVEPALVGLTGLPRTWTEPADFDQALMLIEQRLAEIAAEPSRRAPGDQQPGTPPPSDPRIEPLKALRLALQRQAALAARGAELDAALAEQRDQQTAFERHGLGSTPPYSVTLLDQLLVEERLSKQAAAGAKRAVAAAQRRLETAEKGLAAAERERRSLRTLAEQAKEGEASNGLDGRLEAARLAALAADHHLTAIQAQVAVAKQEQAIAEGRLALLQAKLERIDGKVIFRPEVLAERLAELAERETAIDKRIGALNQASELAEGALFEARQRFSKGDETGLLAERLAAREAELTASRKGVEYLREAVDDLAAARTLWERRYALMDDAGQGDLATWLSETRALLRDLGEERAFVEAEIASLRSMQHSLTRRLDEPSLDKPLRQAITQRTTALATQQDRAEEWLVVQEQLRPLAERLRDQLEKRVRNRTLGQHLEEYQARLSKWWDAELFALKDQGVATRDVVLAIGVFALVLVAVSLLRILLRRAVLPRLGDDAQGPERRTSGALVRALIRKTSPLLVMIVAFHVAMAASGLARGELESWLRTALILALWLQIGLWANAGAIDLLNRQRSRKEQLDPSAVTGYGLILFFVRVGIWAIIAVSILAHFQYPITGLIGALGVGGIAIAFAVQNILSDIFNSMAIILDKPFRVGDFIVTGDTLGVIEHIGVKTTQIRSLSGEQVILSNTDILNSRIRNYKRMRERRVVFKLGVVYQTPADKLERIPRLIEEIVRAQPRARFDRAHFFQYGDFALVFEIVYYVLSADYNLYMDTQQAINLGIYRRFQEAGIAFAYPTQELILRRQGQGPAQQP